MTCLQPESAGLRQRHWQGRPTEANGKQAMSGSYTTKLEGIVLPRYYGNHENWARLEMVLSIQHASHDSPLRYGGIEGL